ncbi:hypothetical protein COLO4_30617 [Corchorus olitorius]|uniref:Bet v I/Major latex protein domain-containing protein n=1 Tax=Corchorus olitorius TaxID=93759 RepID=A0A1R3H7M4_9ROSI|nr:hypothetical protein COLO4_30617 [Corchorus olitorius]
MSSLIGKEEIDIELNAPADKFFDMICNTPNQVSDASADNIQKCDAVNGDFGNNGVVLHWNYFHDGEPRVAKEAMEDIDRKNYSLSFRVFEGDLMKEFKSFILKLQSIPKSNQGEAGSIARWTFEYEKLHEGVAFPNSLLDFAKQVSKDVDSHLIQGV